MATCPKCFEEKATLATHCPNCTHRTDPADQIVFSILAGIAQVVLVVAFLVWITS